MFDAFEAWLRSKDRSEHTIRSYLSDLRQFAVWFEQSNGQALSAQAVTSLDVRDYRQHLQAVKRLKAATVNRKLASISTWLGWAVATGRTEVNPAAGISGVKHTANAIQWLTRQEEGRLLRVLERGVHAARTDAGRRRALRNRALVVLILNTGLRADEALSLRLDDLTLNERSGEVLVRSGKGCKQRTVPLNKEARSALRAWLEVRPSGTDFVFTSQKGNRWANSSARRGMQEIARVAGVEAHLHTLRHTFAKRLVDAGVGLEQVAALLGHASLETTRIYTTPSRGDLVRAVEKLEY